MKKMSRKVRIHRSWMKSSKKTLHLVGIGSSSSLFVVVVKEKFGENKMDKK